MCGITGKTVTLSGENSSMASLIAANGQIEAQNQKRIRPSRRKSICARGSYRQRPGRNLHRGRPGDKPNKKQSSWKADEKTGLRGRAIVKGGKGTAARSLAVLVAMFQFAVGRCLITSNPAKRVKLFKGNKKGKLSQRKRNFYPF